MPRDYVVRFLKSILLVLAVFGVAVSYGATTYIPHDFALFIVSFIMVGLLR